MAFRKFNLLTITQAFENDLHFGEALFFPEVARIETDAPTLIKTVETNAAVLAEATPLLFLHRRIMPEAYETGRLTVELPSPRKTLAWEKPLKVSFRFISWVRGERHTVAYVPALGIEVVVDDPTELDARLRSEIMSDLLRTRRADNLGALARLDRASDVTISQTTFEAVIRTPKAAAEEDNREDRNKKNVFDEVAVDLRKATLKPAFEVDEAVRRIADALTHAVPPSVLLVGPSGVGKTAAFHEFIRRRGEFGFEGRQFWSTTGTDLVAGMTGFGMWQERCRKFREETMKRNAVVHIGNLLELMEVGKSESNELSLASYFRPMFARGDFQAVAECTPEQLAVIERRDPHLLTGFRIVRVEVPGPEPLKAILFSIALRHSPSGTERITLDALDTMYRLHRRYATYSAMPGRAIRFLKNVLDDYDDDVLVEEEEVIAEFSRETGLPLFLLDDAVRMSVAETEAWFTGRVLGQNAAVETVVGLISAVKAALARPNRPLASLLFIGPTGVGKTEMAKALAEFLFQNRDRVVRFDMSEYGDPVAVQRLIGGFGAKEGLLTAKVREQPFCVLLLDEFEKADPSLFDLLLQVLGEGRLTDGAGRVADFTNAVVILTSNLGAETFRQSARGFLPDAQERSDAARHFETEVRKFFRPEFYNRIDRVVPFLPLDEVTAKRVVERELKLAALRDGIRFRSLTLDYAPDVHDVLLANGFDARYGARPLKRTIERELLAPLADALNGFAPDAKLNVTVGASGKNVLVKVTQAEKDPEREAKRRREEAGVRDSLVRLADLRRRIFALDSSTAMREVRNEIYRLERLAAMVRKRGRGTSDEKARLSRLPVLDGIDIRLSALSKTVAEIEEETLMKVYGKEPIERTVLDATMRMCMDERSGIVLDVFATTFQHPDEVVIWIVGENAQTLFALGLDYLRIAVSNDLAVSAVRFTTEDVPQTPPKTDEAGKPLDSSVIPLLGRFTRQELILSDSLGDTESAEKFLKKPESSTVAIALEISGPNAFLLFHQEVGLHLVSRQGKQQKLLVRTFQTLKEFEVSPGLEKRASIGTQTKRRLIDHENRVMDDTLLGTKFPFDNRDAAEVLGQICQSLLRRDAEEYCRK
jgi:ATP-dependent Clp protease ATP-binding subunit ClpC